MKYRKHLRVLIRHFEKGLETETTISEIAELLNCSERHVKTIVNYLDKKGYLTWKVLRGRGRKPKITLHLTYDAFWMEEAKRNAAEGNYQEAFRIVQGLGRHAQNDFQVWFYQQLGVSQTKDDVEKLDVLRYPFYETSLAMDPIMIRSRHDSHMVQQIFERLVEFDPFSEQLVPKIAHHWESMDGMRWIFYLRKNVLFHHGRELKSADVKATIERLPGNMLLKRNLKTIEIPSKTTIVFKLKTIDYLFPRYFANMATSIVPVDVIRQEGDRFRKYPIGSGPFQLKRHDKEMVRLDVFPNYYAARPWLDRIEMIMTPDLFQPKENANPFLLNAPDDSWKEVRIREEGADYITFNCAKDGPVQERRFRQLLCQMIDPQMFCDEKGYEEVATSFLTEKSLQREQCPKKIVENIHCDVELKIAAQQIREGVNHRREAIILQQQLAEFGISATIDILDSNLISNREAIKTYDLFVGGIALSEDRLLSVLTAIQSTKLTIYPCLTESMKRSMAQKVADLQTLRDEEDRWKAYFELEDFLLSNAVIFFLNHRSHNVYEPENSLYANIALDSNGRIDYRHVWKRIH
ncbi:ABC transporter substrate-binding protein [Virgibacillus sp. 179-BFC.A HS]|uniref:ABC transporter substrate-binding protein n=1 Tax=Tigheibacillus jepli TaxID=3035914 RepID=A0ABU5CJK0_9BACI|nr:ABC transporter substrate-binding protein [Virgibacillus sp. 179-BFC.A HS]MDY0406485.1 ABC transporter substrate-binding protein [Virgibacillus sp. 179-BFC.A HS]